MSNAYYQGYGTQLPTNYSSSSQHMQYHQENLGYPNASGAAAGDEYMRQPAVAPPYPTVSADMPQPVMMQHHHHHVQSMPPPTCGPAYQQQQEPQVIIVHQNNEPDCCSCFGDCFRYCCGCLNCAITGACKIAIIVVIILVGIGLVAFFVKFYKKHH